MPTRDFEAFLGEFQKTREQGIPFAVVTLVNSIGSVPQEIGARIIVGQTGLLFGTIGGGELERKAVETARELLASKASEPRFIEWNLQKDLGKTCGGAASLLFEIHHPATHWQIAVFGAGHVAQELVRVLLRLECEITCIDPRVDWLDKLPSDPKLKKIHAENMPDALRELSAQSFIAVLTMGHKTDLPIVAEALRSHNFPYIGAIGSDTKARVLRSCLQEAGIASEKINSVFCPIGEAFGNNTPPEIALSIASQLLRKRDERR